MWAAGLFTRSTKMEVPLELDTVYRLISSPQWTSQDSLLPTDPRIITGSHQALADPLSPSARIRNPT